MSLLRKFMALALTWTLATAVLLELGLRILVPLSSSPLFLPEAVESEDEIAELERRVSQQKGARLFGVPVNSDGFRDTEFTTPKPAELFRIVVLADSFGIMAMVPDSRHFLRELERELAGLSGSRPTEILNLGIPAIGPHHYLAVLQRWGLWLEPDLVAVCVFVGNDFNVAPLERVFRSRWDFLLSYRIFTRLLRLRGAQLASVERSSGQAGSPAPLPAWVDDWRLEAPTLPREEFLAIAERRSRNFNPEVPDARFERTVEYLRRIQEIATRETGRPLVVILIPDEMQVDPAHQAIVEERVGWPLDLDRPNRYLASVLEPERFLLIDLLPALREGHRTLGRVYHLQDTHWNANGNRVATQEIARRLREERSRFQP